MPSLFRRLTDQLTRSPAQLEADELQTGCHRLGTTPVGECVPRSLVEVSGVLRHLVIPPRGEVPALVGELYDGTGTVSLVWLGRREIVGVRAGIYVRARGRVCEREHGLTMFNPSYEILPRPPGD